MAATAFQRQICRLITKSRRDNGESYVAGGVALNTLFQAPRISRDIDLFHDTDEALRTSWTNDRALLAHDAYRLEVIRDAPAYVEALVTKGTDRVIVQWLRESAFRFFPLVEDEDFGLVLHPFDLATNKVLARPAGWSHATGSTSSRPTTSSNRWATSCGPLRKDPGFRLPWRRRVAAAGTRRRS